MTHVINLLERQAEAVFESVLRADLEASYFQLMEQHIHVEVWDASRLKLNTYLGYESLRLLDVAGGSNRQTLSIYNKMERDGEIEGGKVCTLSFKLVFEELWHFLLRFLDFRTSNLEDQHNLQRTINPKITVTMKDKQAIWNQIERDPLKNTKMPYWNQIGRGILFRGTLLDLRQKFVTIKIENKGKVIGTKLVNLVNCLNGQLDTQMIIHKPKEAKQSVKQQTANVKGTIKVAIMPKFIQSGQSIEICKFHRYLVVRITKINSVFESRAITELSEPEVWVDVEWGGIRQASKRTKRPPLNETFYFQLAIPDETTLKKNELADLIIEELSTKPDITLSVWADANNGEVVSLGYAKVLLSDIAQKNAPFADMEFKCQKTREKIPYQSRVLK